MWLSFAKQDFIFSSNYGQKGNCLFDTPRTTLTFGMVAYLIIAFYVAEQKVFSELKFRTVHLSKNILIGNCLFLCWRFGLFQPHRNVKKKMQLPQHDKLWTVAQIFYCLEQSLSFESRPPQFIQSSLSYKILNTGIVGCCKGGC